MIFSFKKKLLLLPIFFMGIMPFCSAEDAGTSTVSDREIDQALDRAIELGTFGDLNVRDLPGSYSSHELLLLLIKNQNEYYIRHKQAFLQQRQRNRKLGWVLPFVCGFGGIATGFALGAIVASTGVFPAFKK